MQQIPGLFAVLLFDCPSFFMFKPHSLTEASSKPAHMALPLGENVTAESLKEQNGAPA